LAGNDILKGGGGADVLNGGWGRDTASYVDSHAAVTVNLMNGTGQGGTAQGDTLISIEDVIGSSYDDLIYGSDASNTLTGGFGNDTLKGGGGVDTLDGGAGNDNLWVDTTGDIASGGAGIDTLVLGRSMTVSLASGELFEGIHGHTHDPTPKVTGIENVSGSALADRIIGSDGANVLHGNDGDDSIDGRAGNDTIVGGWGDDKISGGLGADQLTGGFGNDTFFFRTLDASTLQNGKPQDVILDFVRGSDKIDLFDLDASIESLIFLNGVTIDGVTMSVVGHDANNNDLLDDGEFAVGVVVQNPGLGLGLYDVIV
jgi:Ca2+-binding RTX toxin-like protein